MIKYFYYFIEILCCSIGISIIIIYSNLLMFGCSFGTFVLYVLKTWEFYLLPLGIFLIIKDRF